MDWNEIFYVNGYLREIITLCGYGLLITALTAELATACLLAVHKHLEKFGAYGLLDKLGKTVIFLYFIPIVFCVLRIYHLGVIVEGTFGVAKPRGNYAFDNTGELWIAILCLIFVWLVVAIWKLAAMYRRRKAELSRVLNGYPAPKVLQDKLDAMRSVIGLHRPVELKCCYGIHSAMTCGIFRAKVLIPTNEYSDRELEVIFAHELTHVKRKDVLFRTILDIGENLFWFCPLIGRLHSLLTKWSETCTDIEAGDKVGGVKTYFSVIASLLFRTGAGAIHYGVCMANGEKIEERIMRIQNYQKEQKRKGRKLIVAMLCIATVLGGSLTALAAGEGVAALSDAAYQALEIEEVSEVADPRVNDGIEYIEEAGESDKPVIIQNPVMQQYSTFAPLSWIVPADYICETAYFSAYNGGYIRVALEMDPADVTVHIGIIEPGGRKRYVIVSGEVDHKFTLTISGTYKVYVENMSATTDINVYGGYFYE